jgi:hypothetical protein
MKEVLYVAPDLLTCGVVAADSDALCKKLMPVEAGPTMMCRHTWAIFHELRRYPEGRSFMFNEIDWQDCRGVPVVPASLCDGIRDALRAGDVEACAKAGDGASICRAYMTLDKSFCRMEGELAKATFSMPDRKEGEPATVEIKKAAEESCRKAIDSRAFLAKGLKGLAESGPPRERALARAALGEPDACNSLAEPALEICGGVFSGAQAAEPAATVPASGTGNKGAEPEKKGQDKEAPKPDAPAQVS